jgi:hypothetical protein
MLAGRVMDHIARSRVFPASALGGEESWLETSTNSEAGGGVISPT